MTRALVLFGMLLMASTADAQPAPCLQLATVATLTVAERSYTEVRASAFNGRLYVWAPEIRSSSGGRFTPFQLWLVEGVYGKPFPRPSGALGEADFERLRKSTNVRATGMSVSGPKRQSFVFARQSYWLEVTRVNTSSSGSDTVALSICR
jgi:hypothetical protein